MFEKPAVDHIDNLHHIGRQLAVLKRIYQSYTLIIERILDRQKPVNNLMNRSRNLNDSQYTQPFNKGTSLQDGDLEMLPAFEVPLSPAATVRFERLRDRINLYALSEIQECLDEKESLVFLVGADNALMKGTGSDDVVRISTLSH